MGDAGDKGQRAAMTEESEQAGPKRPYSFEEHAPNARVNHPREAGKDYATLVQRLALLPEIERALRRQLKDFVVQHHENIAWYDKAIDHELWRRRIFFGACLALLVAIPIGIYLLTDKDGHQTAAITAGLSGLFAFQRAIAAWLDKRQLVALYSKTRAQLKTAVYTLEQTWGPDRRESGTIDGLRTALAAATAAARQIVSDEEDAHYEVEAAPTFGLDDIVGAASSKAGDVAGKLAPKPTQDEKDRRAAETTVRQLQEQLAEYRKLLEERRGELANAPADGRAAIITQMNEIGQKTQATEIELAIQVSRLHAM